jgi:hypothetical protein
LANFAFLSKWDNIRIGAEDPASYLAKADEGALRAQWIPIDRDLWKAERFEDFCAKRRELLAGALNDMLGLTSAPDELEPLDAEEVPELEAGAWSDDSGLKTAAA